LIEQRLAAGPELIAGNRHRFERASGEKPDTYLRASIRGRDAPESRRMAL
jgi:hypothetical protein